MSARRLTRCLLLVSILCCTVSQLIISIYIYIRWMMGAKGKNTICCSYHWQTQVGTEATARLVPYGWKRITKVPSSLVKLRGSALLDALHMFHKQFETTNGNMPYICQEGLDKSNLLCVCATVIKISGGYRARTHTCVH